MSSEERQARYQARLDALGLKRITVVVPIELESKVRAALKQFENLQRATQNRSNGRP